MRLKEVAMSVEQRRIAILKNNADRAKRQLKDAQARERIKKAQQNLFKTRTELTGKSFFKPSLVSD